MKLLCLVAVVLSLFAAACGDDDTTAEPADEPAAEPAAEPAEEPAAEEPAAEEPAAEEPAASEYGDQGDIGELLAAAEAEGKVVWLTNAPQVAGQYTADKFKERFGIEVEFLSINDTPMIERYGAEATAGNISIDVLTLNNEPFIADALANGWLVPLEDAGLPVLDLGTFPEQYYSGDYANMNILPFSIWYNSDSLDEADVPQTYEDLTDPKYKGQINMAEPTISDGIVQFWDAIQQAYGDEFFDGYMANEPHFYPAVSAGAQAIAAGEGSIVTPAVHAVGVPLVEAGAPLVEVVPPITTGPAPKIVMTSPDHAPHPNAAKLFVNWILSESGNLEAAGDLTVSIYNTDLIPEGYVLPRVVTDEIRDHIYSLLGF